MNLQGAMTLKVLHDLYSVQPSKNNRSWWIMRLAGEFIIGSVLLRNFVMNIVHVMCYEQRFMNSSYVLFIASHLSNQTIDQIIRLDFNVCQKSQIY